MCLGRGGQTRGEIHMVFGVSVLTSSSPFLRAGVFTGQNSFTFGNGINPLLKSGSFAPPDFSAFLRQDSRGTHIACEFMHTRTADFATRLVRYCRSVESAGWHDVFGDVFGTRVCSAVRYVWPSNKRR